MWMAAFSLFRNRRRNFQSCWPMPLNPLGKNRNCTGQEVEEILQRFNDDTATLRRAMIEYHWMDRSKDGTQYWASTGDNKQEAV
jgi:cobalamin biosynthesis Mg chelatase CobN